nr:hypothetical protein [Tanacetum cinerariifolium]
SGVEWCSVGDGVGGGVVLAVAAGDGWGQMEEWRRVVASDIWDRIDRVTGNIFCFGRKIRRKTFLAAAMVVAGGGRRVVADGRRWPKKMEEMKSMCVFLI